MRLQAFALILALAAPLSAADDAFASTIPPFLKANCVQCHGPDVQMRDIRLDQLHAPGEAAAESDLWTNILDKISLGAMPPKALPRPDAAQTAAFKRAVREELGLSHAIDAAERAGFGKLTLFSTAAPSTSLPMTRLVPDFGRRKFLKSAALGAGGTLLAPMLNNLALAADGIERKAPRFLFVVEGNGLPPEQLVPAGIAFKKREDRDGVRVESLEGATLPVSLAPVEAYRNRLSILQGLSGRMCTGGHSSDHGALGAYHSNGGRNVQAATMTNTCPPSRRTAWTRISKWPRRR